MDPNNVVGAPSAQPQPAPTVAATISAELAATPEPAKPENPMAAAEPEKKSSKGGIIAAILFAIIAAGGVGFGVWAMMDGNTQKDQLNSQIDALKRTNSELMEKLAEDNFDGDSDIDTAVDIEDYIYIEGAGVKIKKPENWRDLIREYSYYNDYPQAVDTFEIRESSDPGDGIYISAVASCDEQVAARRVCFAVDGLNVVVAQMVGELVSVDDSTISEAFWNYFTNPENYSAM